MRTDRDISPPPLKRARIVPPGSARSFTDLQTCQYRFFTWNINGIAPFLQRQHTILSFWANNQDSAHNDKSPPKNRAPSLRNCLKQWNWPHVLCLQEIKIASSDTETQREVERLVKAPKGSDEPSYRTFFSLPRDKFNAQGFGGKLYGVCMIVREDLWKGVDEHGSDNVTVNPVDWDLEGRVLVLRVPALNLTLLNVYAVNGTDNAYKDPKTGEVVGTRHDYKRALHQRLHDFVKDEEQNGAAVVVAGDLNIARSGVDGFPGIRLAASHVRNRADFEDKLLKPQARDGLGMMDSFRHLHGSERKYTYRSPNIAWGASCDRVDLILVSSRLVESDALIEADILDDEESRGPSDHTPSYITLNLEASRPTQIDNSVVKNEYG